MCVQLKDIMQAILIRFEGSLYNSALTKIVYLVDIEALNQCGRQATDIKWLRDNFGPFVWDVIDCAKEYPFIFEVQQEGRHKRQICLKEPYQHISFAGFTMDIGRFVDDAIRKAPNPKADFQAFKDFVYQTPPMILSRGNGPLDVVEAVQAARTVNEVTGALFCDPEWNEAFEYLSVN